jgi:hypothetical protein
MASIVQGLARTGAAACRPGGGEEQPVLSGISGADGEEVKDERDEEKLPPHGASLSSPAFAGEGDQAEPGGGVISEACALYPSPTLRVVPLPIK